MEKIKKIIAFSDIHLRPLKGHESYKLVFNKLIKKIKEEKPDRVVIAGDIFHNKLVTSNEMHIVFGKVLSAIAKISKVIIIPGNHDTVIGSSRIDSIQPMVHLLNNDNIAYYTESGCYPDKWNGNVIWSCWSCLQFQRDPKISEFKESLSEEKGNSYRYVGLYHGVINGSTTDTGFSFGDEGINPDDFYETDFFIAGDIHKYQTYKYKNYKGEGFGVMCGSLIQQNFGESLDNHGYIVITNDYQDEWEYELVEVENEHNYHTLTLTDFEDLELI